MVGLSQILVSITAALLFAYLGAQKNKGFFRIIYMCISMIFFYLTLAVNWGWTNDYGFTQLAALSDISIVIISGLTTFIVGYMLLMYLLGVVNRLRKVKAGIVNVDIGGEVI